MSPAAAAVGPSPGERRRAARQPWCGLLLVDKPAGVTSHDVVDVTRRRLGVKRAGHLGTLDPGASGLLVLAVGAATRCAPVWSGGEKTYQGTLRFGIVTSTQDLSGEVLERHEVDLDERRVREVALGLTGEIEQVPPMVSALKVGGQRLYRLARLGLEVDRAPRRVRVSSWEWLDFDPPEASFRVRCSGGTYVRTLAHDLGARLGTGAALRALRRLRSEPFGLERSVTLEQIEREDPEGIWRRAGIELEEALAGLAVVRLDARGAARIGAGGSVPVVASPVGAGLEPAAAYGPAAIGPRSVVFLGPEEEALALGELAQDPDGEGYLARPHLVFPWAVRTGPGTRAGGASGGGEA